MSGLRRLAGLLVLVLVACGWWDAEEPGPHSSAEAPTGGALEAEPDVTKLLRLEERSFPLLVWAAYIVQQDYFDPARFDPRGQLLSATRFIGLRTPEFFAEARGDTLTVTVRSSTAEFSLEGLADLGAAADRLEAILEFCQSVLDLEDEPLHELEYVAINGMFAPLDPHTVLLTPEQHADLGVRTKGKFGGIGAEIRAEVRRIRIVRVMPDRPAARAGVEAGDLVLKIDEQSTVNMDAQDAQQLLRGPVGTPVRVRLQRGKRVLTVVITREIIRIESVIATALPGGITYLNVSNFQEDTAEQVKRALGSDPPPKGVIIDLRDNSGGLLTQSTAIVDHFVHRGELVVVRSSAGREADPAAKGVVVPDETAVVLMMDEHSASASEIVSGGLKALGRGVVVGRTSFGKGTVQMLKNATPYGRELALKVTVAEYLVAGDGRIQSIGVVPDLVVEPVELTDIRGVVRFFDVERFERSRERARIVNFPSAKHDLPATRAPETAPKLRYLWTGEIPGPLRERVSEREQPRVLDALSDPEIRIAHRVAEALAGSTTAAQRATAVESVARSLASEEDRRVAAALRDERIDWGPAGEAASVELSARARVLADGPVPAGEPFVLRLEVENRGTDPAQRVHAITDCVHDELDGIEMVVGAVGPKQTVTRDLKLHVMPWHVDFTDALSVDVHVGEPAAEPAARARVMLEVAGAPRPAIAYDYWIVDDPALVARAPARPQGPKIAGEPPFEVRGNGDGLLQPGERVLLAFEARNSGVGTSPDVRAVLRNLSGRQGLIEEGLVPLGELRPGARATGAFGLSVHERASPKLPLELDLLVGDARLRTGARDKLRLRVLPRGDAFAAGSGQVVVGDDGARLYNGAHASTAVVGRAPAGARLGVVGTMGSWWVIENGRGRRSFVPKDVAAAAGEGGGAAGPIVREPPVSPPAVELEPTPRQTNADHVTIRGRATHGTRVRDVVVSVLPSGPAQIERKVHYVANPEIRGPAAKSLAFTAKVPLEPGGNRISVIARDGAKVESQHYVWVYRHE